MLQNVRADYAIQFSLELRKPLVRSLDDLKAPGAGSAHRYRIDLHPNDSPSKLPGYEKHIPVSTPHIEQASRWVLDQLSKLKGGLDAPP
jgi:hypothetical protein